MCWDGTLVTVKNWENFYGIAGASKCKNLTVNQHILKQYLFIEVKLQKGDLADKNAKHEDFQPDTTIKYTKNLSTIGNNQKFPFAC